jgi:hypothetical protein
LVGQENYECPLFLSGKYLLEAEEMIAGHPEGHTDSFLYMGNIAFNYYFRAYLKYLEREEPQDDSTLFTFFMLIEHRVEKEVGIDKRIIEMIVSYLSYCRNNFYEFSIQPKFRSRLEKRVDKYLHILNNILQTEHNNAANTYRSISHC